MSTTLNQNELEQYEILTAQGMDGMEAEAKILAQRKITNITEALAAFYGNNPRLIEGMELEGWSGIEGTGHIAEISEDACIVMDVKENEITIELHTELNDFTTNHIQMWTMAVTTVDMS